MQGAKSECCHQRRDLDVEVMLAFVLHHFWHVHNFLLVKGMLPWSTFEGLGGSIQSMLQTKLQVPPVH